ncbi:MAG TPA: DNA cytosine methyltransferase, partial [Opitutales bacterium]|nr:DNA cytosine methyltransferase [Opitutales bacterium]
MGLIVDSFAGGGGASTGIEAALGRPIDIAINHDPEALALHKANHPGTKHIIEDIWGVDPAEVCAGEPVDVMWCSPDCTHFSKAKGGKPRDKRIRGLAWIAVRWARRVRPKVIFLENVEEFRTWGPVDRKGHPVKRLAGRTFWRFVRALQKLGYVVEWRELRACDYGAPTTRLRFYLVARCDGLPIIWPQPTHGTASNPVRTAAECIDWSIPCPSIFDRKKPLADATCRRIAKGIVRYVLNNPQPFIVGCGGRMGQNPARGIDRSVQTVTAKADSCLVVPYFSPVAAFLAKHYTGVVGADLCEPLPTITAKDHNAVVAAHIVRQFGKSVGNPADEPVGTITAGGSGKTLLATSHIVKMRGTNVGQKTDE